MVGDERTSQGKEAGAKLALKLMVLPETMAIARLEADAPSPTWVKQTGFSSILRTDDSLTVVCPQGLVPDGVRSDRDWRCLEVEGPLDLSLTGVLASLTAPLARAGIPIFALSSYETDFILVKEYRLSAARQALEEAGYTVEG